MLRPVLICGDVSAGLVHMLRAMELTPRRIEDPDADAVADAELVVCATEEERGDLEQRIHAAAGKTVAGESPLQLLARLRPDPGVTGPPHRLAVVGTDLKFINPLVTRWRHSGRFEVKVDEWPRFRAHDEATTAGTLEWADIVVCEWAGPNAVLASRTKRPDQRLVVRLHRMELTHPEWRDIDIDAVDVVVAVGPHYRDEILRVTGWPAGKVRVIPNFVDDLQLARAKHPDARFHLGMLGIASSRKRLDLALDTLTELRQADPRYRLFLKGALPWGLKWVEDRPAEQDYFAAIRRRLDEERLLGEAVVFDAPGPDVAAWLRSIGFVLSTSDDESFHLAPAEGAASGAVPMVRSWPGADAIYADEWLSGTAPEMAERILEINSSAVSWAAAAARAQRQVVSRYAFDDVAATWMNLLTDHIG